MYYHPSSIQLIVSMSLSMWCRSTAPYLIFEMLDLSTLQIRIPAFTSPVIYIYDSPLCVMSVGITSKNESFFQVLLSFDLRFARWRSIDHRCSLLSRQRLGGYFRLVYVWMNSHQILVGLVLGSDGTYLSFSIMIRRYLRYVISL